jgi:RND superfamily putative drug exporter
MRRVFELPSRRRAKWWFLLVWVAVFVGLGQFAGALADEQRNDVAAYAPHDAESSLVRDELAGMRRGSPLPAVVVYTRSGPLTQVDRIAVDGDLAVFERLGQVGDPVPAEDGRALLVTVSLDGTDADTVYDATTRIREVARDGAPDGLRVLVTGPAGFLVDGADAFLGLDVTSLLVTLAVIALLLLVIYRSPVLWLVPLVGVLLAVGVAQAAVYFLVRGLDLTISGMTQGILTALVFGAGTDYALLITARYRDELGRTPDRHAAMAVALRHSVPALLGSAATVVAGLLCLLPAAMTTNRALGPVGAAGVAVTLLVMVTFFPALLVVLGRWIFWPRIPAGAGRHRGWQRVARVVGRRPRLAWVTTALVLLGMSVVLLDARGGVPADAAYTNDPESGIGQQALAEHFPGESAVPADIVTNADTARAVAEAAAGTQGVARVLPPTRVGSRAHLPVVLGDPAESSAAEATVTRLRDAVRAVPRADARIGGTTATIVDTKAATTHDRNLVIPAVLAVVLLILMLLLRAVVAPVLLLATVVLSFCAALGTGWLLFDLVLGLPGLDDQAVLLAFVFLVALGVDYNIFLVTRVKEEVAKAGHRAGVLHALVATGGVITSAGVVLAATFTILGLIPVVLAIELGVLVTVGVLLDTFVVRSVLVPALLLDLGPRSWWPRTSQHLGQELLQPR